MTLYDDRFFATRTRYHQPIERATSLLLSLSNEIESVVDLGCGDGHWIRMLANKGIERVLGIEGFEACLPYVSDLPVEIHNLEHELKCDNPFDMVLCIEVAEHLEEQYADNLIITISNFCRLNGLLVFSAAHKGQGGVGHLNLQDKEYWTRKLQRRGFALLLHKTSKLRSQWKKAHVMKWLYQNVMVFRKVN
jgi:2-polyprenyl-3-methyl-5-hydroxy-6-metoxy-1,4-benzoquinol methylase